MTKSKQGFTLIELLVVIGILAVLAAIAIPAVAGLIDKANVSHDNTNANEMTNAIERFASEYELYRQDILSNTLDVNNLDAAQSRVYNVTKATIRKHITDLESEYGFNGIRIDKDTKLPTNTETTQVIIQNYNKTSSAILDPKQSDKSYWYCPSAGVVVVGDNDAVATELNTFVANGKDAKGDDLTPDTGWINLTTDNTLFVDHNSNIVQKGARYVSVSGEEYTEGMELPELKRRDKYYYKEYVYTYYPNDGTSYVIPGWYVTVGSQYRQEEYLSNPISSIRNEPLVKMHQTYLNMPNLKYAPQVPNTVLIMSQTFANCTSLTYSPDIPDNVTVMQQTFYGCTSLRTPPKVSKNVEDLYICFAKSGITSLPDLTHCTKITAMQSTFFDCHNIVDASNFVIPSQVTDIGSLFNGSQNIEKAPVIPESVTDIGSAFANCPKLSGTLTIKSNSIEIYAHSLRGTKIEKIDGPLSDELKLAILQTK